MSATPLFMVMRMDAAAFVLVWALAGQAVADSNVPDDIPAAPRRGAGATAIDRDEIPPAESPPAKKPAGETKPPAATQPIDDDIPVRRPFPRRQPIDEEGSGVRGQGSGKPKSASEAAADEPLPSPNRSKTQPGAKHPDDEPIRVPLRTRVPVDPRTEPATAADAASRERLEQTAPPVRQNNIVPNEEELRRARAAEDPTSPPELLLQALVPPKTGALEGRPISLGEALARRADREGQLRITHAYWKLAVATAAYHYAVLENARVWDVQAPRREDAALVNSIRAAAKAKVHEAQLLALTSQHELSDLLGLGTGAALPLVYDPPHAGAYATRIDELFAGRAVPARMRQIHGTLPALRQAIQARAQAVFEANQAFETAHAGVAGGTARVEDWLTRLNHLGQQRQALLAVVRAYNDDIADYALTVAQAGTPAADLVPMLIRARQAVATKTRVSLNEQPTPARPLPAHPTPPLKTSDGFRPRN